MIQAWVLRIKLYHFAYLAIAISAWIVSVSLYWALWPEWVFKFNKPIEVVTVHPVSGQYLEYTMDYCKNPKYEQRQGTVETFFEDHAIVILPDTRSPLPAGCHVVTVGILLPRLSPGIYYLNVRRQYFINPLKAEITLSRSAAVYIYPPQ